MASLRFSIMRASEHEMDLIREILSEFESTYRTQIDLVILEWPTAWRQILDFITYDNLPDLSLVGTTWITPLCAMQVLRPISPDEAEAVGGKDKYLESVWNAGMVGPALWALPWQVDTRLIFYWKSALRQAGIEAADAFSTYARIEETVAALVAAGQNPIVSSSTPSAQNTLHNVAAWIWSGGGDFLTPSGQQVAFDQPAALDAIFRYFQLHRSLISSRLHGLSAQESDRAFESHKAALTITGPWLIENIESAGSHLLDDLGISPMPGVPYAGGSSLVIWRRSLQELAAFDLIRFLMRRDVQMRLSRASGQLPSRMDLLTDATLNEDRFYAALSGNAQRGRALPNARLWGVIEERLVQTLGLLWKPALDLAEANPRDAVTAPVVRLAQQLNATLRH